MGGWKPGELALVQGMLQRPDLNGQIVALIAFLPSERWQVRLLSSDEEVNIKPDNLLRDTSVSGPGTPGAGLQSADRPEPSVSSPAGASADADGIARMLRELPPDDAWSYGL